MRTIAVAVVAVTFLALSGVAFACGGGGGCGDLWYGGCSTPSDLVWVSPSSATPSVPWVGCTVEHWESTLTVTVTGLTPGTDCGFQGTLQNVGRTILHLYDQIQVKEPPWCRWFVYSDNLVGAFHPPELAPGHTFAYSAEISLASSAGSSCQGASATFVVTISSSGWNTCEGFPNGIQFGVNGGDGNCH